MTRLSGLQRDVLTLYRQCLRALKEKPSDTRPHFREFARAQFRKHIDVSKKDFATIEYLLRRGRNQLESYRDSGIRDIHG
ncbi:complex 1 protein-domain-containing protein [Ampelomyces quisqualis]|uniref:Complex 1 protein-domain-containing protein n=1 Tax=Ampelomyces quisqualis TaxID=50730 RepID=A0A6A5QXL9_AMPQU|nr:complex 1 protein-domain-containing protein [Ampelomyces quisqualis]